MKKSILKILLAIVITLILLISGALIYIKTALPNVGPAPALTVDGTADQIERGEYLAHHVMVCMDCHSQRDWTKFSGPLLEGSLGMGGEVFDQKMGFPGTYVASNLTPFNLSKWTDGEIFRAITSGVGRDGRALFPVMPHANYGQLDPADIKSVIAYLRTLEPIEHETTPSKSDFPMNFILNTIPKAADPNPIPEKSKLAAYGKYLITAASCYDCHTKQEQGQYIGNPYAGGMEFPLPNGTTITSTNITPHEKGLGSWTVGQFVQRFKVFKDSSYVFPDVKEGDHQTIMPWSMYAGMSEEDLTAIFAYLQTIAPYASDE